MPWNNPNTGGQVNMGLQAISGVGNALFPNTYDPQVGMERPNPFKSFSNFQLAGMGASLGPAGMVVGGALDIVKNAVQYSKALNAYHTGQNKQQYYGARGNRQANQQPDYTGMAKYGMQSYNFGGTTPANIEGNELMMQQLPNGGYQQIGMTDNMTPSHEQGGFNVSLPANTAVYPEQYIQPMQQMMSQGNTQGIDQMKMQMMGQANQMAMQGAPYSNGTTMGRDGLMTDAPPSNLMSQLQFNQQPAPTGPAQPTNLATNDQAELEQDVAEIKSSPEEKSMAKDLRTQTRQAAMRSSVYWDAKGQANTYWDEKTKTRYFKDGTPFQMGKTYNKINADKNSKEYTKDVKKASTDEPEIFDNPLFGGQGNISKEEFDENGTSDRPKKLGAGSTNKDFTDLTDPTDPTDPNSYFAQRNYQGDYAPEGSFMGRMINSTTSKSYLQQRHEKLNAIAEKGAISGGIDSKNLSPSALIKRKILEDNANFEIGNKFNQDYGNKEGFDQGYEKEPAPKSTMPIGKGIVILPDAKGFVTIYQEKSPELFMKMRALGYDSLKEKVGNKFQTVLRLHKSEIERDEKVGRLLGSTQYANSPKHMPTKKQDTWQEQQVKRGTSNTAKAEAQKVNSKVATTQSNPKATTMPQLAKKAETTPTKTSPKSTPAYTAMEFGDPRDKDLGNVNSTKYRSAGWEWSSNMGRWVEPIKKMRTLSGDEFSPSTNVNHAIPRGYGNNPNK